MRLCSVEGCEKKHEARSYCKKHWQRWRTHGHPLGCINNCDGIGCKTKDCKGKYYASGFCRLCYYRQDHFKGLQRLYIKTDKYKEYHNRYKQSQSGKLKIIARNKARMRKREICEMDSCAKLGEKHHDDYSKPLDIRFLCRDHHEEHHVMEDYK
ncbi:unnamed protein product [marine sediment metagenome]|uniref:Uncharacterized protein n=1 Tax=marine sediment metagenome TaxID=412755 RepID=X0WFE9_9ZZZZ